MSSAILYVAIVAIWACVLIPRWLRRDSSRHAGNAANAADAEAVPGGVVRGDVVPAAGEEDVSAEDAPAAAVLAGYTETTVYTETATYTERAYAEAVYAETSAGSGGTGAVTGRWKRRREAAPTEAPDAGLAREAPPLTSGESRQRMLAARRRLLGMLILLEAAAIGLAVSGLAALWVLIPPSVMVTGYLLLLREAAHADAEGARREQEAARARARAQARASERAARRASAAATAPPAQAAPAAPAAATAPGAGYDDWSPGRDFAPGLAGKYTASNAEVIDIYAQADEDYRDEYPVKKLRAVGD